jgi:hypothetical protein
MPIQFTTVRPSGALLPISLSAVSEAPTSREFGVEALWRALQIQRLEGSRPWGLWDLYLDETVLMVCEFAVAMRALGFHYRVAERRMVGRRVGESESHQHTAVRQMRDTEPVCAPEQERDSRLGMWIHAVPRLR